MIDFIILFIMLITVPLVCYMVYTLANLNSYGNKMSKFKQKYGYIKNTVECGILLHDFMYPSLGINEEEARSYGRMYKSCYLFLKKPRPRFEYDIEKLREKHLYESKDPFKDGILKTLKFNKKKF